MVNFDVCKRWANSGFACICKEKYGSIHEATRVIRSLLVQKCLYDLPSTSTCQPRLLVRAASSHSQCTNRPFWPLVSKYTILNLVDGFDEKRISSIGIFEVSFCSEVLKKRKKNAEQRVVGVEAVSRFAWAKSLGRVDVLGAAVFSAQYPELRGAIIDEQDSVTRRGGVRVQNVEDYESSKLRK